MQTFVGRNYLFSVFAVLCFSTQIVSGAEPWEHKSPAQWTPQDVQLILTDSPWVKQGTARFPEAMVYDDSRGSAQSDPTAAGVGSRAGMPLPGGQIGRWDGGVGRDRGGTPTLPVTVRWDSALPMRAALVRSGHSDETLARSSADYIITIVGLWPGETAQKPEPPPDNSLGGAPPEVQAEESQRTPQSLGHMRQGLMASARLTPKGQTPIAPEDVVLDRKTGAIHLFFPRTQPIKLDDKEVTLSTQFGPMQLNEKFRLKDMTEKGKLEL